MQFEHKREAQRIGKFSLSPATKCPYFALQDVCKLPFIDLCLSGDVAGNESDGLVGIKWRCTARVFKMRRHALFPPKRTAIATQHIIN